VSDVGFPELRADDMIPTSPDRVALIVAGMHRSGTSAITRVLSLLGADLPKNLVPANAANVTGYWEPERLMRRHNQLLAELGGDWDDWRPLDLDGLSEKSRRQIKDDIVGILAAEYQSAALFVLKDPRICRFLPLYAEMLQESAVGPRYVLPVRNPISVAGSLAAREGFSLEFSMMLWLRHVLDAEAATRGEKRVIVEFEAFIADWRAAVGDIGRRLDLAWPIEPLSAAETIDAFLAAGRPNFSGKEEVAGTDDLAAWVKETYSAVRTLAADPNNAPAISALDAVRAEFDRWSRIFGNATFPEFARLKKNINEECDARTQLEAALERERKRRWPWRRWIERLALGRSPPLVP
jgi:hypothetical protein